MIRRFVLGAGVLSSVGRSGMRGMTVVHGLAVEPPGGAPSFDQVIAHASRLIASGADVRATPATPEKT